MNKIKNIPIPFCGVALGLAAAGNLLQGIYPKTRITLGIFAAIVLFLFLSKVILFFPVFKKEMSNPVQASVSGTFCMTCMLLSVYVKPWLPFAGRILWIIAVLMHFSLILYFSVQFLRKMKASEYHASFYIVYVGIAVASITAPAWDMQIIGKGIAVFATASFLILVYPLTMRYKKYPDIPEALQPLFAISAAPASLCIVGLKNSFGNPWKALLFLLYVIGTILYLPSIRLAIKKVYDTFYPSLAAFTFPLVISAIATGVIKSAVGEMNPTTTILVISWLLKYWFLFQQIMAFFMTLFILNRFGYRLFIWEP